MPNPGASEIFCPTACWSRFADKQVAKDRLDRLSIRAGGHMFAEGGAGLAGD